MTNGGIAVLAWGSLIWRPEQLMIAGGWSSGGPTLRIEFSRVSNNGRLTLVIDETNGVPVEAWFAKSTCSKLQDAIDNLREREGANSTLGIGFVDLLANQISDTAKQRHPEAVQVIAAWIRKQGFDAAIWTAIGPRFPYGPFSVESALAYLRGAQGEVRKKAFEYIRNAPKHVRTPVRERFIVEFPEDA